MTPEVSLALSSSLRSAGSMIVVAQASAAQAPASLLSEAGGRGLEDALLPSEGVNRQDMKVTLLTRDPIVDRERIALDQ